MQSDAEEIALSAFLFPLTAQPWYLSHIYDSMCFTNYDRELVFVAETNYSTEVLHMIVDSGCTLHLIAHLHWLYSPVQTTSTITGIGNHTVQSTYYGLLLGTLNSSDAKTHAFASMAQFLPNSNVSLLSTWRLCNADCEITHRGHPQHGRHGILLPTKQFIPFRWHEASHLWYLTIHKPSKLVVDTFRPKPEELPSKDEVTNDPFIRSRAACERVITPITCISSTNTNGSVAFHGDEARPIQPVKRGAPPIDKESSDSNHDTEDETYPDPTPDQIDQLQTLTRQWALDKNSYCDFDDFTNITHHELAEAEKAHERHLQSHANDLKEIYIHSTAEYIRGTKAQALLLKWHIRLSHLNPRYIIRLAKNKTPGMEELWHIPWETPLPTCDTCKRAKSVAATLPKAKTTRPTEPFHTLIGDMSGKHRVKSISGARYFYIWKDAATGFKMGTPLKSKTGYMESLDYIVKQHNNGVYPKTIRTDGAGEACSETSKARYNELKIKHEIAARNEHWWIGRAESGMNSISTRARLMITHARVPRRLWSHAFHYALEIENRCCPTSVNSNKSCYEAFTGKPPDNSMLRTWGCLCYIHLSKDQRKDWKLDDTAVVAIFLGFSHHLGYHGYVAGSLDGRRLYFTRYNITFNEEVFPYRRHNPQDHRWAIPQTYQPEFGEDSVLVVNQAGQRIEEMTDSSDDDEWEDKLVWHDTDELPQAPVTRLQKQMKAQAPVTSNHDNTVLPPKLTKAQRKAKSAKATAQPQPAALPPAADPNDADDDNEPCEFVWTARNQPAAQTKHANATPQQTITTTIVESPDGISITQHFKTHSLADALASSKQPKRLTALLSHTDQFSTVPNNFLKAQEPDGEQREPTSNDSDPIEELRDPHLAELEHKGRMTTFLGEPTKTYCLHSSSFGESQGPPTRSLYNEQFYNEAIDGLMSYLKESKDNLEPTQYLARMMHFNAAFINYAPEANDQPTVQQATRPEAPNRLGWIRAIKDEYDSWIKPGFDGIPVFNEVDTLPPGRKAINTRCILKLKRTEGKPARYKARIIALGWQSEQGVDYLDSFSAMAQPASLRLMIALASQQHWMLETADVKCAYLQAPLEPGTSVYLKPPKGLAEFCGFNPKKFWKANKSVYGLPPSGRNWNKLLLSDIDRYQFENGRLTPCTNDSCLFVYSHKGKHMLIALVVDDILIAGNDRELIDHFLSFLREKYEVSNDGELKHYLGVAYRRNADGTLQSNQQAYIQQCLERFKLNDADPVSTPMEANFSPTPEDLNYNPDPNLVRNYRSQVASLIYAMIWSRPDIAYAVSVLSRYFACPSKTLLTAAQRVWKYLKGTSTWGIQYSNRNIFDEEDMQLIAFCDASDADCKITGRSTGAYILTLNGVPISWKSARLPRTTLSTCESEYIQTTLACQEILHLREILERMGYPQKPTILYEDNDACIRLSINPTARSRAKHILRRFHFIRECVDREEIILIPISTTLQLADLLTKPLPREQFQFLRNLIMVDTASHFQPA